MKTNACTQGTLKKMHAQRPRTIQGAIQSNHNRNESISSIHYILVSLN